MPAADSTAELVTKATLVSYPNSVDCPLRLNIKGSGRSRGQKNDMWTGIGLVNKSYDFEVADMVDQTARAHFYKIFQPSSAGVTDKFVADLEFFSSRLDIRSGVATYDLKTQLRVYPPGGNRITLGKTYEERATSPFVEGELPTAVSEAVEAMIAKMARDMSENEDIKAECNFKAGPKDVPVEYVTPANSGKLFALLIGISDYADPKVPKLDFAASDALRMRDTLTASGVPAENILVLTNEQATLGAVRNAVGRSHLSKAALEDTVLIYFSGHGAPDTDSRRPDGFEKYLLMYDTKSDSKELYGSGYSMGDLASDTSRLESARIVLAVDSCYSGEVASLRGYKALNLSDDYEIVTESVAVTPAAVPTGMSTSTTPGGEVRWRRESIVLAASGANQVSQEKAELGSSVFTHYLIEGLKGRKADTNRDGRMELPELYEFVSSGVSSTTNGQQRPVMSPAQPTLDVLIPAR